MENGIIVSIILGLSGIISATLWGIIPKRRKSRNEALKAELLNIYKDLYSFIELEKILITELSQISLIKKNQIKISARAKVESNIGRKISRKSEPARIKRKIEILESEA